ncbi:MAG: hypothetical protein U0132_03010 [Gemmatimonadaceae bacterium]
MRSILVHAAGLAALAQALQGGGPPNNTTTLSLWHVVANPLLEIGGADEGGHRQFNRIRGLMRLNTSTIVVADGASSELRYFDVTGTYLKTASRFGSGPGEVNGFDGAFALDDTVYAFDERGPMHVYDAQAHFVRRLDVRALGETSGRTFGWPRGVLRGGAVVGVRRGYTNRMVLELAADSEEIVVVSDGASGGRIVTRFPRSPVFQHASDRVPRLLGFGPLTRLAVFPRELCAAHSSQYRIVCQDDAGHPTRTIVRATVPIQVTPAMRDTFRHDMSGALPGGGSRYPPEARAYREEAARTEAFADVLPAFGRLVAARTGELWVSDSRPEDSMVGFQAAAPTATSHWRVFGPKGVEVGDVTLPARFFLYDAGTDWVLGVSRDDDDVERVVMLRLVR